MLLANCGDHKNRIEQAQTDSNRANAGVFNPQVCGLDTVCLSARASSQVK